MEQLEFQEGWQQFFIPINYWSNLNVTWHVVDKLYIFSTSLLSIFLTVYTLPVGMKINEVQTVLLIRIDLYAF